MNQYFDVGIVSIVESFVDDEIYDSKQVTFEVRCSLHLPI